MKRLLRSKLVLTIAAFLMVMAAIAIPLSGSFSHSHAQAPQSQSLKEVTVQFPVIQINWNTGIDLPGGQVTFAASGDASVTLVEGTGKPSGDPGCIAGPNQPPTIIFPMPGKICNALVGKVGVNGAYFFIGSGGTFSLPAGRLYLTVNQYTNRYNDPNGYWTVKVTFPTSAPKRTLFVLIQGVDTSYSQEQINAGNVFPGFDQSGGIVPFLKNKVKNPAFLEYTYPHTPKLAENPHTFYDCADTFTHTLHDDVVQLSKEITDNIHTFNQSHSGTNTDIWLVGHSQGGVVAFGYLAAYLETSGIIASLPSSATLKGAITLDAPLGGIDPGIADSAAIASQLDFLYGCIKQAQKMGFHEGKSILFPNLTQDTLLGLIKALKGAFSEFSITHLVTGFKDVLNIFEKFISFNGPIFTNLRDMISIWNTAPHGKPHGGMASILQSLFPNSGKTLTNQQVADAARKASKGVLTIGNHMDFLWDAQGCLFPLPFPSPFNFLNTQVVADEGDTASAGVFGRAVPPGEEGQACSPNPVVALFQIPINHDVVLTNADVEQGILNFINSNGGTPTPLEPF